MDRTCIDLQTDRSHSTCALLQSVRLRVFVRFHRERSGREPEGTPTAKSRDRTPIA
jgi:hypothetical protein